MFKCQCVPAALPSIDVCIVCPSPLVAVDLDGDGCNETCDCKKPGGVIISPFLDSFAVAAKLDDLTIIPSAVPTAAESFKVAPQIEKGVCNNCPNIPFYNSEFCSPGLDCGPGGILGRLGGEAKLERQNYNFRNK